MWLTFVISFQLEGKSGDTNPCHCTMSSAWINIGNGKGFSLWIQQQSENAQAGRLCAPDP